MADAYAKVRIVDAYGSLNATDEEMKQGRMRVFMEGHRDAPINQLYTIHNDLSRMTMITRVEGPADAVTVVTPPPAIPGADTYQQRDSLFGGGKPS